MKTNLLYAIENISPSKKLRRIILSVTNLCNSRCKTCTLWKNKKRIEPDFETLEKFADTEIFKQARFLTLTGGEPFLRKDLDEVINLFLRKNSKLDITILTNALLPEIIEEKIKNIPRDVLVTCSFNGREETHDETRGVKGNFKKLMKTLEILKKYKQNANLIFTVTKENYNQLLWAWEFAKKHNLNILFSPEMDYGRLDTEEGRGLSESQKKKVLEQLQKIYKERKRPFFDDTYFWFFKKYYEGRTITNKCYAGTNSIYVDYTGDIYACENSVGRVPSFGNIKTGFEIPKNYMKSIQQRGCYRNCYLLCEMVRNMRKHPIKTIRERDK